MDLATSLGIIGFATYTATYGLLQTGRMDGNSLRYTVLNAVAAALVLFSLVQDYNLASVLIQVTWLLFSGVGVYRCYRDKVTTGLPASEQQSHNEAPVAWGQA